MVRGKGSFVHKRLVNILPPSPVAIDGSTINFAWEEKNYKVHTCSASQSNQFTTQPRPHHISLRIILAAPLLARILKPYNCAPEAVRGAMTCQDAMYTDVDQDPLVGQRPWYK